MSTTAQPPVARITAENRDRLDAQANLSSAIHRYGEAMRMLGRGDVREPYVEDRRAQVKTAITRLIEAARVEGASLV